MVTGCAKCETDATDCTQCKIGFREDGDGCEECADKNCAECENAAEVCSKCMVGFTQGDDVCEECPSNCAECEIDEAACTECMEGFRLVEGTCEECSTGCAKCDNNKEVCTDCMDGYRKDGDGCEECDLTNCKTCDDSKDDCTECLEGNGYISQKCLECNNNGCIDCEDETRCKECDDAWALIGGSCTKCDNCAKCENENDVAVCKTCDPGFALKDDKCEACNTIEENCLLCTENQCTQCNPGFGFDRDGKCVACTDQGVEKCQECRDAPVECETCSDGYEFLITGDDSVDKSKCTRYCWKCGPDSDWGDEDQCGGTHGDDEDEFNELEECPGSCWARLEHKDGKDKYQRTCDDGGCSSGEEKCEQKDGAYLCSRCCTGTRCNTFSPDSATNIAISSLLLAVTVVINLLVRF
jgi:hypothetical protein